MPDQVIGVPIKSSTYRIEGASRCYLPDSAGQYQIPSPAEGSNTFRKGKGNFVVKRMNKLGKKADTFAHGIREHVRLGPKISETVNGKLSLEGKNSSSRRCGYDIQTIVLCRRRGEAVEGMPMLFINNSSDRSIKIPSPNGEFLRVHYNVLIPLEKIKGVNESENMKKPSQKYMEIVTVDDFEFWFMGFFNYQKTFKYLQQAISQRLLHDVLVIF
ncbi:GEM-like protein 6 [Hibiscus syriacus]|uniref:GEM-like protein 6 n=1 Tax=Hibiscus syriacus TaxID=106335 RepID=UPI0019207932|nr:GEM-like protein 6 [Hibiscus syriacus]